MVDADATEVHIAASRRRVARGLGRAPGEVAGARTTVLGEWLAERLLTPEELIQHRAARTRGPRGSAGDRSTR